MTLHARSDVLSVALSVSHGGCGEVHTRPVENGAPVKVWALTCPQCERHLKGDPHWGGMISDIPETPDEEKIRLDQEKRGQRDAVNAQAQALQEIAKLPEGLATALAQAFTQAFAQAQAAGTPSPLLQPTGAAPVKVTCPDGHENLASSRFCGECGQSLLPPLDTTEDAADTGDGNDDPADDDDLNGKSMAELREIAKELKAKTTNSRAAQIQLIRDARATEA